MNHSSEHDASIVESFQAQRLARITLSERDLAASAYSLDFGAMRIDFCIHALMPSCRWQGSMERGNVAAVSEDLKV
jgi:NADPH-dependent ferric siderophore reductase